MTREQVMAIQQVIDAAPDGLLQAELVVTAAQDSTSPLHTLFEWDDALAAHKARLDRARGIIRNVRTLIVRGERTYRDIVYVKHPQMPSRTAGYASVATMTDAPTMLAALDMELARIASAIERGRRLARQFDLADKFEDMLMVAVTKP